MVRNVKMMKNVMKLSHEMVVHVRETRNDHDVVYRQNK